MNELTIRLRMLVRTYRTKDQTKTDLAKLSGDYENKRSLGNSYQRPYEKSPTEGYPLSLLVIRYDTLTARRTSIRVIVAIVVAVRILITISVTIGPLAVHDRITTTTPAVPCILAEVVTLVGAVVVIVLIALRPVRTTDRFLAMRGRTGFYTITTTFGHFEQRRR